MEVRILSDFFLQLLGFGHDEVCLSAEKLSCLMEIGHALMPFDYFDRNAEILEI